MGEENKPGGKDTFYTFQNSGHAPAASTPAVEAVRVEPAVEAAHAEPASDLTHAEPAGEAALRAQAAYDAEFPEAGDAAKRKKRLRGILGFAVFTVVLCAAALIAGAFGVGGLSLAGPQSPAPVVGEQDLSLATVYLNSLPWDRKPHDSLKNLEKMKNVRSALQFFGKYPASQVAQMKAEPVDMGGAATRYETLAGTLVEISAKAKHIAAVDESITLGGDSSSALVTLEADGTIGAASLLVIGTPPAGVQEGGTLTCKCIPIYLFLPKQGAGQGGIFFITLSELLRSAK